MLGGFGLVDGWMTMIRKQGLLTGSQNKSGGPVRTLFRGSEISTEKGTHSSYTRRSSDDPSKPLESLRKSRCSKMG